MILGLSENILDIPTFAFPKILTNTVDLYKNKVISFDLEVKPFCTGYDPNCIIIEVRKSDISRIHRLFCSYNNLQSK